jgi:predicted ATPase
VVTKVAFVGAHGVGKTTLVESLLQRLVAQGHEVARTDEVPRILAAQANDPTTFRRNNNTMSKQFLIMLKQIVDETSVGNDARFLLCDRALLDHWAYTTYFNREALDAQQTFLLLDQVVADYCGSYRQLFYIPIEFAVIDDGTREADYEFQKAIDDLIVGFLDRHHVSFVTLGGAVESRVETVLGTIGGLL